MRDYPFEVGVVTKDGVVFTKIAVGNLGRLKVTAVKPLRVVCVRSLACRFVAWKENRACPQG